MPNSCQICHVIFAISKKRPEAGVFQLPVAVCLYHVFAGKAYRVCRLATKANRLMSGDNLRQLAVTKPKRGVMQ